jgi:hypothetical protein
MCEPATELRIHLRDGRAICERYNQREMAEFIRANMLERIQRAEPLVCFDGEQVTIPADRVEKIELTESATV